MKSRRRPGPPPPVHSLDGSQFRPAAFDHDQADADLPREGEPSSPRIHHAAEHETTLPADVLATASAQSDGMTSIHVQGLTKRFGDVLAVDNLSFEVGQGSVTGFLGPNGSGKTTTLRMLLGLATPTAGTATINGTAYRQLVNPSRCVGAVLESTSFHPGRRARDHLRMLCVAAGLPPRRADEALAEVGLADAGSRRVKGFSLGMRQRLGLAAALLGEPEVLILDEPANGLDPEGVHWLRRFLRSYADGGRTVLVSSHLLAEVAQTVDDVVIIAGGRLVTHSSLANLASKATRGVWVRTPQAELLRNALAAREVVADVKSADTVVALSTTTDAVGLIAAGAGVVIYEMTAQRFDLEELFLELTTTSGGVR
jgi:ABC-2 type transport system ATP-binding protein